MKIHYPSVDEALARLHSKREELSATEAARRLQEYGENRIERLACVPLWRCFLASLEALLTQQVTELRKGIRARLPMTQVMPGDILQARNILLAGSEIMAGEAHAVVFATGRHNEFSKIVRLSLLN